VIGSGGMGTVYLARDSRLHRRIALKFIQTDSLSGDEDAVSRLLHEARAASALNHPSVCQVYDVGGEGRDSWIAMEYVEGRPLAAVIPPGGLPPGEVVRLGAQIAEALAHAHERGVLHRDLKTANIVCDSAGRAKILDFGIARRLHVPQDVTTTRVPVDSAVAGTLAYMAPEVVRGEPQDERSDLWSLGVVLYEMASGRRPFEGTNVFDVAGAVVRDAPPQLPEHVPASLRSVVERLLAKSPAERYRGAGEVAAALTVLRAPQSRSPRPAARIWLPIALIVLTGLMGLLWLRRGADVAMRITHQQLVSPAGAGHKAPAYSPDGNRIAFTGPDPSGVDQVWVQEIGSGAAIQLTHDAVAANHPRWLGSDRLLYASGGRGLWTIPSLGGTPTRLVEAGTNPDVSRDGTRIVFEAQRGLWTARSDGSEVRKIEGTAPVYYRLPMGPALSPDATSVAYFHAAVGPNGDFWVIPLSGGKPKQLTSDLREGGWPVWTPDGRSIIFSSARAGSRTLWRVSAGGGEPTPVTTGAGEDDQPHISADGRLLAYTNVRNSWELKTLDLTSRSMQTLMRRGLEIIFPVFSPDGRRIAYFGRADEAVAVFTIGVDGSDPRQLTAGRELHHSPRCSAD
jgi:Tol biopolymer transport system component